MEKVFLKQDVSPEKVHPFEGFLKVTYPRTLSSHATSHLKLEEQVNHFDITDAVPYVRLRSCHHSACTSPI